MRKLELVQPCDFVPAHGDATSDPLVSRCRACGHTVRNLSEMTEADARSFLERKRPGECVRFKFEADDGRIVFSDGVGALAWRLAKGARPMIVMASLLAACETSQKNAPEAGIATAPEVVTLSHPPPSTSAVLDPSPASAPASSAPCERASAPPASHGSSAKVPARAQSPTPKPLQELAGY